MAFRLFLARPQVKASCSGTVDIEQRAINTPNYPGNFDNYGRCSWLISSTQSIKLVFTSFSVESGYDFLFVYDGTSNSSTLIGKYDGHLAGHVVESSGKHLFLEFTSDGNVTQSGFLINIEGRGVLFVSEKHTQKHTDNCIEPKMRLFANNKISLFTLVHFSRL